MNLTPAHPRHASNSFPRKSFSAAVAALAAAMLTLNTTDLRAAAGSWKANAADQGLSVTITGGASWTVSSNLVEGDAVFLGFTSGVGLGTNFSYYYAVGVGSTPSSTVRFSQSPGASTFNSSGGVDLVVTKVPTWFTAGNWTDGIVPNGVDDAATIVNQPTMNTVMLDHDLTLGSLSVDTSTSASRATDSAGVPFAGSNGLSLIATSRTGAPLSTLTLKRSSGTPSVTLSGGNSFTFSDSRINANTGAGNASGKLVVVGNQGLVIDNLNTIAPPVAVNSRSLEVPVSNAPTYGVGQVRFGFGLDWSRFSGDLTLVQGAFQTLAGGTLNNNLTSLPMNSKVVLGTGSNHARLEIIGNTGQTVIRGLESTSLNSSIINTSAVVNTTGIGLSTFEIGSYGLATDSFDYAGNIGASTDIATVASASSIRLVKAGPGTQILSGPNNLNGSSTNSILVAINGGKLALATNVALATNGAIGTVTDGQGVANTDSSILLKNGEFALSGLGNSTTPRSQAFGGELLFGTVTPTSTGSDVNQANQSNSFSTLTVTADPAQPATLTFGSLSPRNFFGGGPLHSNLNGITMLYRGTNLGAPPAAGVGTINFTTPLSVGDGNLNGSGSVDTAQAPVLKGALADTSATGTGLGFATYDPTNGVRLLKVSEQTVVASGTAYDSASPSDNIVLNLTANEPITGHRSNTLQINNASGVGQTVTNSGTALNAANGLLFSGTAPIVLTGGQITGTVDADAEDVLFHSINTSTAGVTIQMPVTNFTVSGLRQGWITYNGPGNFRLEGTQTVGFVGPSTALSTFGGIAFNSTGTTTVAAPIINATTLNINQGTVKLDTGASWTNLPRLLLAPEGKFDLNGIGSTATTNRFTDINSAVLASGLSLNPISGEVTNSSGTNVDLILSTATNGATSTSFFGTLTGNLNLIVDKSSYNGGTFVYTYGTQSFANVNTYTGSTQVRSGVLHLGRGGLLPPTTVVTLGPPAIIPDATSYPNSTLTIGDANGSTNGGVRLEISGLYATGIGAGLGTVATGNGTSAVTNAGSVVSQLTLNIANGVYNGYDGNLGIAPAANGSNANLFTLRKIGSGTFEPKGVINSYTGGTIIQEGILRVSSDAKLGQVGPLTGPAGSAAAPEAPISAFANNIVLDGGTLQTTTTADFILNPKRGIGLGPIAGSTGGTGALWVDSGVTLSYGGVIASSGNTGTQTLVKNGLGHLALNGASTFTGVTQVVAGTLGGSGSLASGLSLVSGGALAPGNGGTGTFTVNGALTLTSGAVMNMEIGAPGVSDLLQLGGAVNASGTTTINLIDIGGAAAGAYTLISGTAPISASNFAIGTTPAGFRGTLSAASGVLTVTLAPGSALSGLESWRSAKFGNSENTGNGADTFDADNDGLPNLLEYATGTEPLIAQPSTILLGRSGEFLTLTYTRIADTTLTYTVEGSSDLTTWSTISTGNNPSTGAQNVVGPVTVEDTVSATAAPGRRFLRLKVSY